MKLRVILLTSILCAIFSVISCAKSPKKEFKFKIAPDSTISATLGITITEALFSPSKVTCYSLKGKDIVDNNDVEIIPHYVRDSMICKLKSDDIAILQFILLSAPDNYSIDSIRVRSPYVPEMEFCFSRNKFDVHVVISFSDFSWSIIGDGKNQGNWNYTDREMISRFRRLMRKK